MKHPGSGRRALGAALISAAVLTAWGCGAEPLTVEQVHSRYGWISRHAIWLLPRAEVSVTGVLVARPRCITERVCGKECCGCGAVLQLEAPGDAPTKTVSLRVSGPRCTGNTCGEASCEDVKLGATHTATGYLDAQTNGQAFSLAVSSLRDADDAELAANAERPLRSAVPRTVWVVIAVLVAVPMLGLAGRWAMGAARRMARARAGKPVRPIASRARELSGGQLWRISWRGVLVAVPCAAVGAFVTYQASKVADPMANVGAVILAFGAMLVTLWVSLSVTTHFSTRRAAGAPGMGLLGLAGNLVASALMMLIPLALSFGGARDNLGMLWLLLPCIPMAGLVGAAVSDWAA